MYSVLLYYNWRPELLRIVLYVVGLRWRRLPETDVPPLLFRGRAHAAYVLVACLAMARTGRCLVYVVIQ